MKKLLFTLLASAAIFTSCTQKNEYVIYGTVSKPDLEGAKIFLVPMNGPIKENMDSTYIKNLSFEFRGTEERLVDIRLERMRRFGTESLLVVTEPGEIYVSIGEISFGRGTPQNDTLQVWKDLTLEFVQQAKPLFKRGDEEGFKNLQESYYKRTSQMASNVGLNSTLGAFLGERVKEDTK